MSPSVVPVRQIHDTALFANRAALPLFEHGLSSVAGLQMYYPRVRDRADLQVLRCPRSGVIMLDRSDHMGLVHYREQDGFAYWRVANRAEALARTRRDDLRRVEQFGHLLRGKRCLDVGAGTGGFLDAARSLARTIAGVEPQPGVRQVLRDAGHIMYPSCESVDQTGLDVATVFHVLEHMTEPVDALSQVRRRLRPGGIVIVEVPHARDLLLSHFDHAAFKAFTFWSEHLILHTRASLTLYLELAGFRDVSVTGHQRYPLANHLHWLLQNEPGGHERHPELSNEALDRAYANQLDTLDATDTLVAIGVARAPGEHQ